MNKKLSPEAQAVLDHFLADVEISLDHGIAAVLRATTDQVVPSNYESFTGHAEWDQGMEARHDAIRESLLALADELDSNYPEKPDSSVDSNLKAKLTSCQQLPTSLVPMEYADLDSGARIVCEPSEEASRACWTVPNVIGIHRFEEFPTPEAAWQAIQQIIGAQS